MAVPPCAKARIEQTLANRLLAALGPADRHHLLADAVFVELGATTVLGLGGTALAHAYFPTTCMISLLAPESGDKRLVLGLTGYEGVYGGACALGIFSTAFDAVVTGAGQAWQIDAGRLAAHGRSSPALLRLLSRFLYVELRQLGTQAICSHFHSLRQRLARCLLMSQDRMRSSDLWLTHDDLSQMLGARRAGVTVAAGDLQALGLIRYTRGHIFIADRAQLLTQTCACYFQDQTIYSQTMWTPTPAEPANGTKLPHPQPGPPTRSAE
ncbi:Crp/Fnr family transcriptional regulator [Hydrogenophaga defluvii]|uniref:Crp/Fnr family transcriptional regulator n=1 Tax=Hydrogenophaga defluvii TaxID=249410 RepID=A0ABW2SCB1_9BURK